MTPGRKRRNKTHSFRKREKNRQAWGKINILELYCCGCQAYTDARLTDGSEIYSHRPDLYDIPFWICDICGNYVGCHHKLPSRVQPLGDIPTPEIRNARNHIHAILDPLWKEGRHRRHELYQMIADALGKKRYHTAWIKSIDEARQVYLIIKQISTSEGKTQ